MKKLKLLFVLPNLNGGGAERVIVNILNNLDEKMFDIHLVLAQNSGVYFDSLPEYVHLKKFHYKKTIFSLFGIRSAISDIKPDVVFCTTHRMNFIVAMASKLVMKNFILMLRLPNSPKLEFENNQLSATQKAMYTFAYNSADYVVAQTYEMGEEIHQYFKVAKQNIRVLINPIDKKLIERSLVDVSNPFDEEKINIVAAGRLIEQKGFDVLIKAMKSVVEKNKRFYLNILGEDVIGQQKELEKLVDDLKLKDYVKFWGYQKNPYKFFKFSDVYVLSSRWEGLPNTVLENLYLDKPIVSTRCVAILDKLIEDGANGYLVDVNETDPLSYAILHYESLKDRGNRMQEAVDINNFFQELSGNR